MTIWNHKKSVFNWRFKFWVFFFFLCSFFSLIAPQCRVQATAHRPDTDPPCPPARSQCRRQNPTRPHTPRTWTRLRICCLSTTQCQCQSDEIRNLNYPRAHPHLDLSWTARIQRTTTSRPTVAAPAPTDEAAQRTGGRVSPAPTRPCWQSSLTAATMSLYAQTALFEERSSWISASAFMLRELESR